MNVPVEFFFLGFPATFKVMPSAFPSVCFRAATFGIWILLVGLAIPLKGQVIWQENFNYPNGTTTGANNNPANPAPDWTSQCPNCTSGDWFEVRGNQMEALDVNGPATLETEWIDISAFPQGVEVLVDLDESGDMEGCPGGVSSGCNSVDWIRIEYSIDGSAYSDWTSPNGGPCSGSCAGASYVTIGNFNAFTFSQCPLNGDSLRLRISVQCWATTEYIYLDNIVVQGQNCVQFLPTDSLVGISCFGAGDGEIWVFPPDADPSYTYSLNGGTFQGGNSFTGLGPGTYSVIVRDSAGQMDTLSELVITEPEPLSIGVAAQDADCNNNNGMINTLVSGGTAPYSYVWDSDPPQFSATASGLPGGIYGVTVTDLNGCATSADSILIGILEEASTVYVPNAFTPNGDGLNDEFLPVVSDATSYYLGVYDRWGKLVFETRNSAAGWDGTFNGSPLPRGVYVFTLRAGSCNGKLNDRNGSVTILR